MKRGITAGLIADRGPYEPMIPTDKTLESYRTAELKHREDGIHAWVKIHKFVGAAVLW